MRSSQSTAAGLGGRFGWLVVPVSVLGGDFVFRWGMVAPPNLTTHPSNLIASAMFSFLFWWAIHRLISGRTHRWWWAGLVAGPAASLMAAVWQFRAMTGSDPTAPVLTYLWQEPGSTLRIISSGTSTLFGLGVVALAVVWTMGLGGAGRHDPPPAGRRAAVAALAPWICAAVFWPAGLPAGQTPFTADFHATKAFVEAGKHLVIGDTLHPLGVADRVPVPAAAHAVDGPNIILVVGESLRRDRMQIFGHNRATTPNMQAFFEAHPAEAFRFDRAMSTAAYTQLSVPTILSGLYMAHRRITMHRAPLVWHYARAAGAQTFLVSPQQWSWQGLEDFTLLDHPPDQVVTAETIGANVINDLGVDDRLASARLVDILDDELDPTRPFLGIVQTNSTHYPLLPKDDVGWDTETVRATYDAAVALTDETFGRMVDALADNDLLDDTVIVFMADHSEFFYDHDSPGRHDADTLRQGGLRISSCHPEILRIPMFAYIPQKWAARLMIDPQVVRGNRRRLVSTVDVVPTVLDLWNIESLPRRAGIDRLDGRSLLEAIPDQRAAYCFNSARWNLRSGSGFAAFTNDRAVYGRTSFDHLQVYDMHDPSTWKERAAGRPPTAKDRAWIDRLIDPAPFVEPYVDYVRMARQGISRTL